MLGKIDLHNILFLDIETVPLYEDFVQVPEEEKYFLPKKQLTNEKMKSRLKLFTKEQEFGQNLEKLSAFLWVILRLLIKEKNFALKALLERKKNF